MEFNDYQIAAARTANPKGDHLLMGVLGLAGEVGEVVDLVKKYMYHGHGLDGDKLRKELGDVLWGLSLVAKSRGIALDDVATTNIAKLKARYPEGFSYAASRDRAEDDE